MRTKASQDKYHHHHEILRFQRGGGPTYIHIYTPNIRNLDSFRLFSPRFDSRVPDRLIELGRREMLRGNFSNRAAIERGKHATPTTRRKISIPSLPCFLPPSVCVFLREFYFYLYSFSTFRNCIYIELPFPSNFRYFFFSFSIASPSSIRFVIVG